VVIDAIRAALADCCDGFRVPAAPQVMQLNNAQHLWSPISARPRPGWTCSNWPSACIPTPATNGQPRDDAQTWLKLAEPFDRGWFTGAAGLLRRTAAASSGCCCAAHGSGARAELYAGAGIVAGSDPNSEWDETEAKLAAMLSALQYA
jgi:salicylate biosynthesis isochorismate synthase